MTSESTTAKAICVSLEWAKKLKNAGWPQEDIHCFYWADAEVTKQGIRLMWRSHKTIYHYTDGCQSNRRYINLKWAAPTAEEILRRLPRYLPCSLRNQYIDGMLTITNTDLWQVGYQNSGYWCNWRNTHDCTALSDLSLANAAAAMYCYLADNRLLA